VATRTVEVLDNLLDSVLVLEIGDNDGVHTPLCELRDMLFLTDYGMEVGLGVGDVFSV
jgi:hypothetical protein